MSHRFEITLLISPTQSLVCTNKCPNFEMALLLRMWEYQTDLRVDSRMWDYRMDLRTEGNQTHHFVFR